MHQSGQVDRLKGEPLRMRNGLEVSEERLQPGNLALEIPHRRDHGLFGGLSIVAQ